jgi:hypothetical protein
MMVKTAFGFTSPGDKDTCGVQQIIPNSSMTPTERIWDRLHAAADMMTAFQHGFVKKTVLHMQYNNRLSLKSRHVFQCFYTDF